MHRHIGRIVRRALVVPRDNAAEAALVDALRVFPAEHLLEVCAHVQGPDAHAALRPGARGPDRRTARGAGGHQVPVPRQTRDRDRRARWPQPPDIMSALTLPGP